MSSVNGVQGFPIEETWNSMSRKLLVYMVGAKSLTKAGMKGVPDVFVKVTVGKETHKTGTVKKTLDPVFNGEMFLFRMDSNAELSFELRDKTNAIKDEFLGFASVQNIETKFKPNTVYDERIELGARKTQKGSKKDSVSGTLFFRIMWTDQPETRPESSIDDHQFFYDEHVANLKTGDLIAYDAFGMIPSYVKLSSNSQFSNVGLVVQLANKWTKRPEFYIIETTRNIDHFLDAFKEVPLTGANVTIFRLFERLHHVHAANVWLIPATTFTQVNAEFQMYLNSLVANHISLQNTVKEVLPDAFSGIVMNEQTCQAPGLVFYIKKVFGKQRSVYVYQEMFGYVREIYSTAAMIRFSRALGRHHQPADTKIVYPIEFITNPSLFRTPILIRTLKNDRPPPMVVNPNGMVNHATLRHTMPNVMAQQPPQQHMIQQNVVQQQPIVQQQMVQQHSVVTGVSLPQQLNSQQVAPNAQGTVRYQSPPPYQQAPPQQQFSQNPAPNQYPHATARTNSGQYPVQGAPQQAPSQQYPPQGYSNAPVPQYQGQYNPQQYPVSPQQHNPTQYSQVPSYQTPNNSGPSPQYPSPPQGAPQPSFNQNPASNQYPTPSASYSSYSSSATNNAQPPSYEQYQVQASNSYPGQLPSSNDATSPTKEQVYHNRHTFSGTLRKNEEEPPKGISYPDLFSPDGFAMNLPSVPNTNPTAVPANVQKPFRASGSLIPG